MLKHVRWIKVTVGSIKTVENVGNKVGLTKELMHEDKNGVGL